MGRARRRRGRAGAASLVVGALVLATWLPAADATRTVKIASQISIHERGLHFHGRVTASKSACESNRRVVLYRKFSNGTHQALGSTKTDQGGHWRLNVSGSAGISMARFFAKARRRSEGTAGTIFVCQRARSKTISFH